MNKSLLFTIDFPPHVGGVANYYREVCNHLPSDKIAVLALKNGGELDFDYNVYREKLLTDKPIWPKWLPAFWYLYKIIRKEKIKNVLIGHVLPLGTVAHFLSKIFKFDCYVFTHGLDILIAQKSKRKDILLKRILRCAKGVITNSEFTKKELLKLGVLEDKITVVYPCPHFKPPAQEEIKNELTEKYNLNDKKIILSVGRAVERKGFDMVIKSMEEVVKKDSSAVYLLASGNGNYEEKLKDLAVNSVAKNNIIFIEKSSPEEIKALFDICDIFIMPSRQIGEDVEGFGIVYLEANLFGKPVIAGRSGGAVEAVIHNETGLVVNPKSTEEISEAILRLLQNRDLAQKLGAQGKKRAENNFSWDKQVEKLKSIL